jgi:hypothetical protein
MSQNQSPFAPMGACEIATLRIHLLHIEPLIWRQLEVPTAITLGALHEVVQAAMCWSGTHLWEFMIDERRYGMPDSDDWQDEPLEDADDTTLGNLLKPRTTVIDYVYDFGDNWELRLTLTNRRTGTPDTAYPRYVGGERNAPPEDCGGVPGFRELLDALSDPDNPDHAEMLEWVGDYNPAFVDDASIRADLADMAS